MNIKDFFEKYILDNIAFYICTGIAVALLITSFFLPPMGEIHPSVLQGAAELFAFAGLGTIVHAIDKGRTAKISHGQTILEVKKDADDDKIDRR